MGKRIATVMLIGFALSACVIEDDDGGRGHHHDRGTRGYRDPGYMVPVPPPPPPPYYRHY